MAHALTIEDFVRQRLGDRENVDYFPGEGELSALCWRHVVCREARTSFVFQALEFRENPLPTPGVLTTGMFWAYCYSSYAPSIYRYLYDCCAFDRGLHQPGHRYGVFQANAYLDDVYIDVQPEIDEVSLTLKFATVVSGAVTLTGLAININRVMHDVFTSIADDIAKLAIYQSTLGGATDLREAKRIAREEAQAWLQGGRIPIIPMRGTRRY